jgi:hypothetical protein
MSKEELAEMGFKDTISDKCMQVKIIGVNESLAEKSNDQMLEIERRFVNTFFKDDAKQKYFDDRTKYYEDRKKKESVGQSSLSGLGSDDASKDDAMDFQSVNALDSDDASEEAVIKKNEAFLSAHALAENINNHLDFIFFRQHNEADILKRITDFSQLISSHFDAKDDNLSLNNVFFNLIEIIRKFLTQESGKKDFLKFNSSTTIDGKVEESIQNVKFGPKNKNMSELSEDKLTNDPNENFINNICAIDNFTTYIINLAYNYKDTERIKLYDIYSETLSKIYALRKPEHVILAASGGSKTRRRKMKMSSKMRRRKMKMSSKMRRRKMKMSKKNKNALNNVF